MSRVLRWCWLVAAIFLGAKPARSGVPPLVVPTPPLPEPVPAEPAAPCAEPSQGRVVLGVRTGWAFPFGSFEKGQMLRSNFTGMLPLWVDAGYRINRQVYVGAYFGWGGLFVADTVCPKNLDCTASDIRFGVNAEWHFKWIIGEGRWAGPFDPWIGLGSGYELAKIRLRTQDGATSRENDGGFEFANVQLGGDYVGGPWRLGGFAALSVAEYTSRTEITPNGEQGFDIRHPATHLWLTLGVRFQYDL